MEQPEYCVRCGAKFGSLTMSFFNTDIICGDCADDERKAPGYAAAKAREEVAVLQGNFNFKGVGLSNEDRAFLTALRRKRTK